MSAADNASGAPQGFTPATTVWDGEADDVLVCQAVRDETHDVKSFVLKPAAPGLFRFQPGQFMTYAFEIGGEVLYRCYTISSAPTRPDRLSFTVKRVPGGPVSNWLHDTMKPGMRLRAVGPMGEFTCSRHPAKKYLFLSGGSGITPLMSMSRTFHDLGEDQDIVFVHSARSSADIIFREELEAMARVNAAFRFVPIAQNVSAHAPWTGLRGFLDRRALELVAPDFLEREVFVCGPAPYMAAVREMLAAPASTRRATTTRASTSRPCRRRRRSRPSRARRRSRPNSKRRRCAASRSSSPRPGAASTCRKR